MQAATGDEGGSSATQRGHGLIDVEGAGDGLDQSDLSAAAAGGRQCAIDGQIVYIRRCGAELCFVDIMTAGQTRVELVVKAARVPKLLKLGDCIAAQGEWEEEGVCLRTTSVPRVVRRHDPARPFVPIPAPPRHPRAEERPATHCRFHLSSKACPRGDACRHRHAPLGSPEFAAAVAARLAALEHTRAHATYDAADPFGGKKARKSHRAELLAAWSKETFGAGRAVLEVAGGGGLLARELLRSGAAATVLLVDPRAERAGAAAGLRLDARPFEVDYEAAGPVDLLLALHPDEATDAALEWASRRGIECAVVPCCVFADRFPRDGHVRTYEQLLAYLAKRYATQTAFLPLQGRNVVLYRRAPDLQAAEDNE
jgi:hypothetical protein